MHYGQKISKPIEKDMALHVREIKNDVLILVRRYSERMKVSIMTANDSPLTM